MRFSVESWSPEYGVADRRRRARRRVRARRRHRRAAARRLGADRAGAARAAGADHVRRRRAPHRRPGLDPLTPTASHAGVCASVAAGVVECDGRVGRGHRRASSGPLIAPAAAGAETVTTRHAAYEFVPTVGDDPRAVYLAIHEPDDRARAVARRRPRLRPGRLRRPAARPQRPVRRRLREDPARAVPARRGRAGARPAR